MAKVDAHRKRSAGLRYGLKLGMVGNVKLIGSWQKLGLVTMGDIAKVPHAQATVTEVEKTLNDAGFAIDAYDVERIAWVSASLMSQADRRNAFDMSRSSLDQPWLTFRGICDRYEHESTRAGWYE